MQSDLQNQFTKLIYEIVLQNIFPINDIKEDKYGNY